MCQQTADFRMGADCRDILLVGACPGEAEERLGRPFIGDAGQNLRTMIIALHERDPVIFPSADLDDYSMLNAHPLPRNRDRDGFDGKTEPSEEEVLAPENIERLREHIARVSPRIVLYLGKTAKYIDPIIRDTAPWAEVLMTGHPSRSAWNTRKEYQGLTANEKLNRWAIDKLVEIYPP